MSAHLCLNADGSVESSCPKCGQKNTLVDVELVDKDFAERNFIPPNLAEDISDDGVFEIVACFSCGYKWIRNSGLATTSQIKGVLLSHFIHYVRDCTATDLEESIDELYALGAIPRDEELGLQFQSSSYMEEIKLNLLAVLEGYISGCDADDLLDIYNTIYKDDYVEEVVDNAELHRNIGACSVAQVFCDD